MNRWESLTLHPNCAGTYAIELVLAYAALMFVQGGGGNSNGLVSNLRSYLWIPVGQNTDKSLKACV
jgi:hypothetical protein